MNDLILNRVRAELARRGWSVYRLVREMGETGQHRRSAIYGWLSGRRRVTDDTASEVLAALELKIKP